MPQGLSGIRDGSADALILDAGVAYANLDLTAFEEAPADGANPLDAAISGEDVVQFGATRGGNQFAFGRTFREIEADGKLGPTVGFKRRQEVAPTVTLNLLEMTVENFRRAVAGAITDAVGDYTRITGGPVEAVSYLRNVAIVTTYTGSDNPIVIGVRNALATDAPAFDTTDEDEVVLSVTFQGHFAGAEATDEPWFIYHPNAAAPAA